MTGVSRFIVIDFRAPLNAGVPATIVHDEDTANPYNPAD